MQEDPGASAELVERCLEAYRERQHGIDVFSSSVRDYFLKHPKLRQGTPPPLHSVKHRLKSEASLRDKLRRKCGTVIAEPGELFDRVTDLGGVRLLHLYQAQFREIHGTIRDQVDRKDWVLREDPVAYTWDPESVRFFEELGLKVVQRDTLYTSIHFLVKPRTDSDICCEVQVRTLFEEIWGEIDHTINYPHPTDSLACREQLRVLSRLVGAGSRLGDAIFRAHDEHKANRQQDAKG
jgi:putative GTP pyrophosphokinase